MTSAPMTAASPAQAAARAPGEAAPAPASTPAPLPTPPTLAEAERLTPASDFKPFVARSVAPEVRNAAMKKLFADPCFNVMDGLDIYIDDYAKPDPLPLSMLRQMASAQFLNLFEDEAQNPAPSVTQCALPAAAADDAPVNNPGPEPDSDHDHIDLRLQPNHAAGPQAPGRGPE